MSYQSRHSGVKIDAAVDQLATLTETAAASSVSAAEAAGSAATATTKAAEAAVSAANAVAVVTGGTATLTPEAGKIPLAGADAQFAHGWVAPPALPPSRPSLLLDFKKGHIDPRITFTRASAATYFDSQGVLRTALAGEPRIDHNPLTGSCLGLLIEEQRTNLFLHSEDFTQAVWSKYGCTVTANSRSAPDGTMTADKLVENTANIEHYLEQVISVAPGAASWTFSKILFAGERNKGKISFVHIGETNSVSSITFDLAAGTIAGPSDRVTATSITPLGNGAYRVVIIGTTTVACTSLRGRITLVDAANATVYTGDGASGLYLWGPQFEAGAFPTSYIKTTTAATRAADLATMTGANFTSWYRPTEGSLVVHYTSGPTVSARSVVAVSDGTTINMIHCRLSSGGLHQFEIYKDGVQNVSIAGGTIATVNTPFAQAVAYKNNDCARSLSGAGVETDMSSALPIATKLVIGSSGGGGSQLCGHIPRLAYYPVRLRNAELVALSAA